MFKYSYLFIFFTIYIFSSDTFYYQNNQKVKLLKLTEGDILATHYYKTPQNKIIGVNNEIIIRLKNETNVEGLSSKYDFIILEKLSDKIYLVQVQNNNQTLDIANLLHYEDDVEYAQPNFIKIPTKR
jgi:hypothetical protein